MEEVEKRTMKRTVFYKWKIYYRYRVMKIGLRARANVFLLIRRAKGVIDGIKKYCIRRKEGKRKRDKAKRLREARLKDKSVTGFIRNVIGTSLKRKLNAKAAVFYKHSQQYKCFLCWKSSKAFGLEREFLKSTAKSYNEKRIKKNLFDLFKALPLAMKNRYEIKKKLQLLVV
jgi:hypothetical protein